MNKDDAIFSDDYIEEDKVEKEIVKCAKRKETSHDLEIEENVYEIAKPKRIIIKRKISND